MERPRIPLYQSGPFAVHQGVRGEKYVEVTPAQRHYRDPIMLNGEQIQKEIMKLRKEKHLTALEVLVFFYILSSLERYNIFRKPIRYMAKDLCMSTNNVSKILSKLLKEGLIVRENRHNRISTYSIKPIYCYRGNNVEIEKNGTGELDWTREAKEKKVEYLRMEE